MYWYYYVLMTGFQYTTKYCSSHDEKNIIQTEHKLHHEMSKY